MLRITSLVTLLALAASATALAVPSTPSSDPVADIAATGATGLPLEALGAAEGTAAAVADSLGCQEVVRLDLTWYGARVTDTRRVEGEFLHPYSWTETVLRQVPVIERVPEETLRLVDGVLQPVTQMVERQVGVRTESSVTTHSVDLAVAAAFQESYLEWETLRPSVLVTLPVGLPALASGTQGGLTSACGDDLVLSYVPDPHAEGIDVWCAGCMAQPADGWSRHLLSLRVWLADADDLERLAGAGSDLASARDLERQVEERAEALGLTPADAVEQAGLRDDAPESTGADSGAATPAPASVAPASAHAPLGLAILGAAAPLGLLALLRRRT